MSGIIGLDVNHNVHVSIVFAIRTALRRREIRYDGVFTANQARQNNPNLQSYFSSHWSQQATTFISCQKLSFDWRCSVGVTSCARVNSCTGLNVAYL